MHRLPPDYETFRSPLPKPLERSPREYFQSGNLFFTAEVEERTLPYVMDLVRPDIILWASDYPHERERGEFGGDIPYLRARDDLSEEAKTAILWDNAVRFYRLDERALSERASEGPVDGHRDEALRTLRRQL